MLPAMRRALGAAAALLLAGCGVSAVPPEEQASISQAVVGGANDTTGRFSRVYALKLERTGLPNTLCSATLITSRTLLTAAHCLPPEVIKVSATNVTPAPSSSPSFVVSTDWRRHPQWTAGNPAAFDVGLVLLPAPVADAPIPFSRANPTALIGRPLTVVGYGLTSPGASDQGTRRSVDLTFRNVTAAHVVVGNQVDKGICFGDSGGPSLHTFPDGLARVVGVHSYTQPASNCTDGLDSRVDLYSAFIQQWLTDKEGGGTCFEDGLCKPGCTPADFDCACVADGACSAACTNLLSDPDCPPDCAANGVCTALACPRPDPDCTAELAPCTADAQCASRRCVTDTQRGNERYCARTCAAPADCPAMTTCTSGACFKLQKPEVAAGGACEAARDFCLGGSTCQAVPTAGTRCTSTCGTCSGGLRCVGGFCLGSDVPGVAAGAVCPSTGALCLEGTTCQSAGAAGQRCTQSCTNTASCPAALRCLSGFCLGADIPTVAAGAPCPAAGAFCLDDTTCAPLPGLGPRCSKACTAATDCPSGLLCTAGFCLGSDVQSAAAGQPCAPGSTLCPAAFVCEALPRLATACEQACTVDDDCVVGRSCVQGQGGERYCEKDFLLLPALGESLPASPKASGCASAGGLSGLAWLSLAALRRRQSASLRTKA